MDKESQHKLSSLSAAMNAIMAVNSIALIAAASLAVVGNELGVILKLGITCFALSGVSVLGAFFYSLTPLQRMNDLLQRVNSTWIVTQEHMERARIAVSFLALLLMVIGIILIVAELSSSAISEFFHRLTTLNCA